MMLLVPEAGDTAVICLIIENEELCRGDGERRRRLSIRPPLTFQPGLSW